MTDRGGLPLPPPATGMARPRWGAVRSVPTWEGRRPPPRDLAIALAAATVDVLLFSYVLADPTAAKPPVVPEPAVVVLGYAAIGAAVLAWRRRYPFLVLGLLCAHAVVGSLLLTYRPVLLVCVATAAAAAAADTPWRLLGAVGAAVLTSTAWVANEVRTSPEVTDAGKAAVVGAGYVLLLLAAVGIGLFERAGVLRAMDLERRNEEEARAAVATERRRIARELHDIVAHTVTVMTLQSAGARALLTTDPGRARDALASVQQAGVQAIGELRRLLGVLRADDADPGDAADIDRQPGLADVDALVDRVRAVGLDVTVLAEGSPGTLDPSVELAAFRVIQEALTNATKHAGPGSSAVVRLGWEPGALLVEVRDDGRGASPRPRSASTGHGLLGLAERVAVAEGSLDTGPVPGGGFRVAARLPAGRPRLSQELRDPDLTVTAPRPADRATTGDS
jgi:signal transduction histidine kinase